MVGCCGQVHGRDLACVDQGLLRLCVNLRSCGCVPTLDRVSPFNELILGWVLGSTHIVISLLKFMNTKCRMHSAKQCCAYSLDYSFSCRMFPTLAEYQS
jgi:hypothetical protein